MWAALRADLALYRRLHSQHDARPASLLRCLASKCLLMLALLRLDRRTIELRRSRRWSARVVLFRLISGIGHEIVALLAKADLTNETHLEPGVYLSDRGNLVIGARRIGAGTVIHHCVTIGMDLATSATPSIGSDVWIGPDCVVYGDIHIGDGATLLGGTVVTKNVLPRTVMGGNPARVVRRDFDNERLRTTLQYDAELQTLARSPA